MILYVQIDDMAQTEIHLCSFMIKIIVMPSSKLNERTVEDSSPYLWLEIMKWCPYSSLIMATLVKCFIFFWVIQLLPLTNADQGQWKQKQNLDKRGTTVQSSSCPFCISYKSQLGPLRKEVSAHTSQNNLNWIAKLWL